MRGGMDRRRLVTGALALSGFSGLAGCTSLAAPPALRSGAASGQGTPRLIPVRAELNRLFDITVCLRPFRAAGPRLEAEAIGQTLVVHNYGHGGSGWSLSWGSAEVAVAIAMQSAPTEIAVLGCGALGLTSAITAQQAGAKVTIYARDLLPRTRSARATGIWSPDSRIALTDKAAAGFPALWEKMARTSFKTYRSYLGLPGAPVEWIDEYNVRDRPRALASAALAPGELDFASYGDLIRDINPSSVAVPPEASPFPAPFVRRNSVMRFNLADYGHTLMNDFLIAGGQIVRREFRSPAELATLPQKVVITCPGYGARALFKDESITPVRGQIGWLTPQPELNYGFYYAGVGVIPRRDGIVVQALGGGDMRGYGDENETPNRAESEAAIATIARLTSRMQANRAA